MDAPHSLLPYVAGEVTSGAPLYERGDRTLADFRGLIRSADLDKPVTRLESLQQVGPQPQKEVKEKDSAAVADTYPD
jgi:hypothetical protein